MIERQEIIRRSAAAGFILLIFISTLCFSSAQSYAKQMGLKEALGECLVIRTALQRIICYDKVVSDYKIQTHTPAKDLDTEHDVGKWQIKHQTSTISDSKDIYMELDADNLLRKVDGDTIRPLLVIQCSTKYVENISVYVVWNVNLGVHNKTITLDHRFDRNEYLRSNWKLSNDRRAAFYHEPIFFIKSMLKSRELQIQIEPPKEQAFIARFNLDGYKNVVKSIKEECGW